MNTPTQHVIGIVEGTDQSVLSRPTSSYDRNFYKVFMSDFLYCLDKIGNQKTKIFCWVINNMDKDNRFSYTYRQIAKETGVSYSVVAETMRTLLDADFFRKDGKVLIINPDVLFKGTFKRRQQVCRQYDEADRYGNGMGIDEEPERTKKEIRVLRRDIATQQKNLSKDKKRLKHIERMFEKEIEGTDIETIHTRIQTGDVPS